MNKYEVYLRQEDICLWYISNNLKRGWHLVFYSIVFPIKKPLRIVFGWDCCEKARREENPVIKDMYISFAEDWIGRAEKFLEDVE